MKNCISILSLKFVSSAKNNQEHALINKHLLGRCSWPWILRNTVPIHVRFTWNEKIWALSLPIVNGIKSLHDVQMFVFIIKKWVCVAILAFSELAFFSRLRGQYHCFKKWMPTFLGKTNGAIKLQRVYILLSYFSVIFNQIGLSNVFPSWSSASVCKIHIKSRKKIPYKSKILSFDCLKKILYVSFLK